MRWAFLYHAGLYATSAALLKLAGFVFFMWLARTLSIEDYAKWGLLYALQTGITSFGLVGIAEAVIGLLKTHETKDEKSRLFSAANASFMVVSALSLGFSALLFTVLNGNGGAPFTIGFVLASGWLLAYSSLQAQIVRLDERHIASLCFNFGVPLCGLIGSLIAFLYMRSVASFFVGSTLGLAGALAVERFYRPGGYSMSPDRKHRNAILVRVSPFIVITLLGWLGGYGNNYLIKLFFESAEVAKFTFAFMLATIMQLIATALNQVWGPRFYRIVHALPLHEVEKQSRKFLLFQGLMLGLAGGLLLMLYPVAIRLVGGGLMNYGSMHFELFLLVSAYVILVPYWHFQNYLLAFDRGGSLMKTHVATGILGIILLLSFMWVFGPLGVYVGFLVQMALRSTGVYLVARREWPIALGAHGLIAGLVISLTGFLASGAKLP